MFSKMGYSVIPSSHLSPRDAYLDGEEFKYILWLDRIYQKIQELPGHIVEVGVARGRNAILFGQLIKMNGEDSVRNYYGFDTFDGYVSEDLQSNPHLSAKAWKGISKDYVEGRLKALGLNSVSHLIQGDIKETASRFMQEGARRFSSNHMKVALLYIDCNAKEPAQFAMEFFYPHMVNGGIICIDEKRQGGELAALSEFAEKHSLKLQRDAGVFGLPAFVQKPLS